MRLDRWELALWGAGALLWAACVNAVPFGDYVDDVVWTLLARRLAHGSLAADWSFFPRLETTLPWGFSLLLAPAAALAGPHALVFKAASAGMTLGGLALLYLALRQRLEPAARRAWLALLLFNGLLLSFDGAVMSEAGFILLFGASVRLCAARGRLRESTDGGAAALGALGGLLTLTRLLGAAWVAAVCLELWRAGRRRQALIHAAAAAAIAAPYLVAARLGEAGYSGAGAGWALPVRAGAGVAARATAANAYFYAKGLALLSAVYFPAFWPNVGWLKALAVALVLAAAALGAARVADDPVGKALVRHAGLFFAACAVWPFQAPRLIAPLYPLFAYWLAAGVAALTPARRRAVALAALAAAGALSNAASIAATARASWTQPVDSPHEAESRLGRRAGPGDLVISMDVARVRYFTGLRGAHFIASASAEDFARRARELGARWFFVRPGGYVAFAPGLDNAVAAQQDRLAAYLARADLFELVEETPSEGARLYVLRGAAPQAASSATAGIKGK